MTQTVHIEPSQNEAWGFFGTIAQHAEPQAAWNMASLAIAKATGEPPWSVRAFLDSRFGRHFADEVAMTLDDDATKNHEAIDAAVARWMNWTTNKTTERAHGIPRGLPYLVGFVVHCGIEDEALAKEGN